MMKFKIAIAFFMAICTQSVLSQTKTVNGNVADNSGSPLPGVSVIVLGTNNGVSTDFDGNYSIDNISSTDKLVYSFIGMTSQTIEVGDKTTINVVLEESAESLTEVVVVGYGTQSRAEVTGAIETISSKEISALPVTNAEQALQGRAAGVTITNSGSPGTAPVVRIRGYGTPNDNSPLYVIDGVISQSLGNINANDIETINVLKDASTTAIYGSQGSNGVIIVTTKKGKTGKTSISFNTYSGVNYTTKRYDLLNTQQYLKYANDAFGVVPTSPLSSSNNDTDWQDEIFQSGLMQSYDFAISGGGEDNTFRFSAGYVDQEGALIETGFERFSFRANSNFTLGKFKFGETLSLAFNNQNPESSNGGRSLIEHAIKSAPYLPVYNENNNGGFQGPSNSLDGQDAENPVRIASLGNAENKGVTIAGSIFGEFEILQGLNFKSQVGLEHISFNNNAFVPSFNDDSEGATHSSTFATITKNSGTIKGITLTNSLNYDVSFNDVHNLELLLLAEKQDVTTETLNSNSQNPITDDINQVSNESSFLQSQTIEYEKIGYLARANYNYDQKYLVAASIRRDASSRFGKNNRWGTFPSLAVGWNISQEDFMTDTKWSNLKLRASWGKAGNDKIGDYQYSSTLTSDFIYPIGGAAVGTTAAGLGNPNLKWEEKTMTNIGLDLGWLNNSITASIEYFNNTSDDLLYRVPTPLSAGFDQNYLYQNVGSVETNGLELNVGYNDFEGDFTWSASVNLGTSKNEVTSLGEVLQFLEGGNFESENLQRISVGEPLFYFHGFKTDGIYQNQAEVDAVFGPGQTTVAPGDVKILDLNGDNQINADDKTKIGTPYPDLIYGLNANANYKNWDLNMFITGVSGVDVYNTNIYDLEGMPRLFNAGTGVLNRWTGEGTSNSVPRAGGAPQNTQASDRFLEDGSYTRLKNITIGYTVNNESFSKYFSNLRLYVSGQNLITLTDYSGLDPEIGLSTVINNSNYELGIDRGTYPQPKSLLFGIQMSF
ncbi:SusC/RagA family TonB-linked outer membrane protein [Urechidicola croceus]|uniref:SusC/RagA family TonB-linked outer membrane protein n=1 Tax=Urechidicola croceus TaxID=1850246 RepID=A0A1D8P6E2_9FLAO|nr:TonB-dependent receptor [Urechidicola croceus]AOW20140.1 SusC/RagA family TonB-linked outer membrane protein [Urechidicola croceus]